MGKTKVRRISGIRDILGFDKGGSGLFLNPVNHKGRCENGKEDLPVLETADIRREREWQRIYQAR